jgi:hypothetical protein
MFDEQGSGGLQGFWGERRLVDDRQNQKSWQKEARRREQALGPSSSAQVPQGKDSLQKAAFRNTEWSPPTHVTTSWFLPGHSLLPRFCPFHLDGSPQRAVASV